MGTFSILIGLGLFEGDGEICGVAVLSTEDEVVAVIWRLLIDGHPPRGTLLNNRMLLRLLGSIDLCGDCKN